MNQLLQIQCFVAVIDKGSFSAASDHLDIAKSAVSKRVSELEKRLGVLLLNRTTRRVSQTEAGALYYRQAKQILEDLKAADDSVGTHSVNLKGTLRLAASLSFGLKHLTPLLNQYMQMHPELHIDLDLNDRLIDVIEDGFDLVIRIGKLPDSSLIARRLAPIRIMTCASPSYIQTFGEPHQPQELKTHRFLAYSNASKALTFIDQNNKEITISPESSSRANNGEFLLESAINGLGIVTLPTFLIHEDLKQGRLVRVMPTYRNPELAAYAVYPPTRYLSVKVRSMIDFLTEKFGDQPYWDQDCTMATNVTI